MNDFPRVTFGIIVLNGEPFIRYNLRSLYLFAHEIIVVEGASKKAAAIATPDGHSTDSTLEVLHRFKAEEDPENKLTIVTAEDHAYPNGFWPGEKDEQSQAYAECATGDCLWQVDIDEFYHSKDIRTVLMMFASDPSIRGASFHWKNFWGGFDYLVDGWEYRGIIKKINGNRRVFRWGKGYRYVSHRPPTVVDDQGRDLCTQHWIGPNETAKFGIFCYHYGMVFPKQARQKTVYYRSMWQSHKDMDTWYHESFLELRRPFRILHGTRPPSWLRRFDGDHPPEIRRLIEDCKQGIITVEQRPTDDIERLLNSRSYQVATVLLDLLYYIMGTMRLIRCMFTASRRLLRVIRSILRRLIKPPLESLPNAPDLFRAYRYLYQHPDLERKPGGWFYKGEFYPDYLTVGGASYAIFRDALKFCQGQGIDVGAGLWPLPGAVPVDVWRGPGVGRNVADFEDGSLDYVFSSHCLEHIENWRKALSEWIKKLKPGGVIFLYLPHPDCAIWHPGSPFVGHGHKWIPTPEVIKQTLRELGCEIVQLGDGPDAMQSFYICERKQSGVDL